MKKLFFPLMVLAIASLSSCGSGSGKSSDSDTIKFVNNCDNLEWFNATTLSQDLAKSGTTSSKLDDKNEFSYGLQVKGSKIEGMHKLKGEVWCNLQDSTAKISVVIQGVDSLGKSICWVGTDLKDKTKANKNWGVIPFECKLPEKIAKSDVFKIYVWNPGKKLVFVDDWNIEFTK